MLGAFLASFGQQMLSVALGWELYERTGLALALGGIGLALVLPVICLRASAALVAQVAPPDCRGSRGRPCPMLRTPHTVF